MENKIGAVKIESVVLKLPVETVENMGESSFRSVSGTDDSANAKVTVEKDFTYFIFNGEPYIFTGIRYFPKLHEGVGEAKVNLENTGGVPLGEEELGQFKTLTLERFHRMLVNGELEPISEPDHF